MLGILAFIIFLTAIITAHEFGHFLAAKKSGVLVEEFNIGFPPRLIAKRIGETLYSLNLIPIGGYVKLFGENEDNLKTAPRLLGRAFFSQPAAKRLLIISAGVLMNLLTGIIIFAFVYTKLGIPQKIPWVKVTAVVPDSPAAAAGITSGDYILKVDGQKAATPASLISLVKKDKGLKVKLLLATASPRPSWQSVLCPVSSPTPHCYRRPVLARRRPPAGQGALGVVISNQIIAQPPIWQRSFLGVWAGLRESFFWGREIFRGLGQMTVQIGRGHAPQGIAGPLGVYQISQQIQHQSGWLAWLHFFGILSINLAIINILPLPALDGGQLVLILIEMVTRRRLSVKFKMIINQIGLLFLLGLLAVLTFHDLHWI